MESMGGIVIPMLQIFNIKASRERLAFMKRPRNISDVGVGLHYFFFGLTSRYSAASLMMAARWIQ
jgi:hypothetical protein